MLHFLKNATGANLLLRDPVLFRWHVSTGVVLHKDATLYIKCPLKLEFIETV